MKSQNNSDFLKSLKSANRKEIVMRGTIGLLLLVVLIVFLVRCSGPEHSTETEPSAVVTEMTENVVSTEVTETTVTTETPATPSESEAETVPTEREPTEDMTQSTEPATKKPADPASQKPTQNSSNTSNSQSEPSDSPVIEAPKPQPTEPSATEAPKPQSSEPAAPTECPHDWETIYHPEEGHYDSGLECACGARFKTTAEWGKHIDSFSPSELVNHMGNHSYDEWIVDQSAWTETVCRICGAKK